MAMSFRLIGTITTAILGTIGIIAAGYNFVMWIDDIYIDVDELSTVINEQNVILGTINDNVVNLGLAIYDRKISEIEALIKQVESIENPNEQEKAFLVLLNDQLLGIKRKRKDLTNIKVVTP